MAKKFCYSEKKTLARIKKKQNHRGVPDSQFENGQDAEEEDGDGELGILKNLANGYLKLVHEIETHLCLPAPRMVEAKPEREVGGKTDQNTEIEEEISQSSEDTTHPGIGFVNLYRRNTHFECLGIPLTSLELFSMERQRNADTEEPASLKSLDEGLSKETEWVPERNISNEADYDPPEKVNIIENTSKSTLIPRKPDINKFIQKIKGKTVLDQETDAMLNEEHENQCSTIEPYQDLPKFQSRSTGSHLKNPKSMQSYKCGTFPAKCTRKKIKSLCPIIREVDNCSETTKHRCHIDFRNVGGPKSSRFKNKSRNTMINESKLFPSSSICPCRPEGESKRCYPDKTIALHGGSGPKAAIPSALKTHLFSSDSEMFGGSHDPNPVESSSMKVSGNSTPDKLCLKKSISPIVKSDFEPLEPLRSDDSFTEAWMNLNFKRVQNQQDLRIGGLYRRGEKLKFQPIDRLDAGWVGLPLFKDSEESLERTQYFVTEFDKLSHADKVQDIELRMSQLRWLHATSDHEYRQHFRKQRIPFKKVLTNSVQYACPLNNDECPAVMNDTLLAHFVSRHLDEPGKELREIFEGEQMLMIFSPRAFQLAKTECISVLGYGGVRNKPCTLPAVRFMLTPNSGLPEAYDHFDGHLPLLVMICRNPMGTVEGRKERFEGLEDEDTLALWMVSRDLPCPIHVAMTVLSRRLDITRSSIMKVRGLHKSQDPLDFMLSNKNYMRLSNHDLRVLTNDHREPIYLEIVVKEYVDIP
uniref:AT08991p n=1 Tax=Drosophila melanogaster TaxID=7227 RepID=Q8T3R3_DROME|nr:AT08991p [Drosophila melanogaster]